MASRPSSARNGARVPFSDATSRANSVSYAAPQPPATAGHNYYSENTAPSPMKLDPSLSAVVPAPVAVPAPSREAPAPSAHSSNASNSKRNSAVSGDSQQTYDSPRTSQYSQYSSCEGFPNKKSHIGPWQLGKTLGKGSSARVRAARHCVSQLPVAVKIIAKKTARMTQSGSIAQLDQVDSSLPESINGVRRMPLAIEREVAILKLIEHPNIVKLYDIWENRNEIYLILEYVENGDLFTYVSNNGALTEEGSMFVFRQMMSAVQYCHAYNICHRDLKPENILLKSNGQIKIADFGMAALHQGPRSHLQTSCGSPHYAAPELLKARPYRGDKADIWSMGVILFVMLAGRLPFDEEDMSVMLAKAKKGIYTMPSRFSPEAKDLVHRILQVEPSVRISMNEMWQHPLVWKYGYLDDLGADGTDGHGAGSRGTQMRPLDLADIDTQIFRQLRSMWHTLREDDLAAKLVSNEPNEQKQFYWLLYNYRERQLENFNSNLTHSMSDYHHVNKVTYTKKVSTRQFSQQKAPGVKRSVSRFTVISNVAETEADTEYGTVRSYDPYRASPSTRPAEPRASHAKIVVHRNGSATTADADVKSIVQAESIKARTAASAASNQRAYGHQRRTTGTHLRSSRSSVNSLRSIRSNGRHGTTGARSAARYRRGVDFSHVRKPSAHQRQQSISSTAPVAHAAASRSVTADIKTPDPSLLWNEDLADFSFRIAKDLDEAFMSSLLTVDLTEADDGRNSPFSLRLNTTQTTRQTSVSVSPPPAETQKQSSARPWDSRPLPPSPPRSESVQLEILKAQEERTRYARAVAASSEKRPSSTPVDMASYEATFSSRSSGRRVVSEPAYAPRHGSKSSRYYHKESSQTKRTAEADKPRVVSAPSKKHEYDHQEENEGLQHLAKKEDTIRVVVSPSVARSAQVMVVPEPLNLPKKSNRAAPDVRRHFSSGGRLSGRSMHRAEQPLMQPTIIEEDSRSSLTSDQNTAQLMKSWFRRPSKGDSRTGTVHSNPETTQGAIPGNALRDATPEPEAPALPHALARRKSFVFPFWKTSKSDPKLMAARLEAAKGPETLEDSRKMARVEKAKAKARGHRGSTRPSWYVNTSDSEANLRRIEPQQNWLARIFHVKPARRHLCLAISQRRARQEIVLLLRDWRCYGIRDIEVDKERNVIFARVGSDNYLGIREASFACEIITVIEHGKRNHLSIIRMTQERGSANSFHKVADTIKTVMRERHLLVPDKRKAKMMVRTLNS